jgi:hypothetical protein
VGRPSSNLQRGGEMDYSAETSLTDWSKAEWKRKLISDLSSISEWLYISLYRKGHWTRICRADEHDMIRN